MSNDLKKAPSLLDGIIRFCLENKLVVGLALLFAVGCGILVAPFDWQIPGIERYPVPVDAIPDTGENQQIVFTPWPGSSPEDVEDQITKELTAQLQGIAGVKTIRSGSFFGFSSIQIIFEDDVEFYWSRTRILEKLSSIPPKALPPGVRPILGPDATALGQVYWYTLEGRDENGNPTGGWDLDELRTIQDFTVRYALQSAGGVSEVAAIGGHVRQYQVNVIKEKLKRYNIKLSDVFQAIKRSNLDTGARTIEANRAEYVLRGIGFIKNKQDIIDSVIPSKSPVPVSIGDVADVVLGPDIRRGALDKGGAEAVGGVVVVRYGANPLKVIQNVKEKKKQIDKGLPKKPIIGKNVAPETVRRFALANGLGDTSVITKQNRQDWLDWAAKNKDQIPNWLTISQVKIVPFYDRTGLIYETLGTLNTALTEEILVTIIVVLVMVLHLRSSVLISGLLPVAVLICFIGMKAFGVDANVVALSGIAIAIGTMVDMGIVLCENILKHLDAAPPEKNRLEVIYDAATEVGGAIITAVATTVVSFLPVFTMQAEEGKLFKPLAYTKSFALIASIIVAIAMIPPFAHLLFTGRFRRDRTRKIFNGLLVIGGIVLAATLSLWAGAILIVFGAYKLAEASLTPKIKARAGLAASGLAMLVVAVVLTNHWLPLGPQKGLIRNFLFVGGLIGGLLLFFQLFMMIYESILRWCLAHKLLFLLIPVALMFAGGFAWSSLGSEFMPRLDEGSYLYMPSTMPHASIGEALDVLAKIDMAISSLPEIESAVGKLGRAQSALDPAPISMIETIINYKSEYITDKDGHRLRFQYDEKEKKFLVQKGSLPSGVDRIEGRFLLGQPKPRTILIEDPDGRPFRQWRPEIRNAGDIWKEIARVTKITGSTPGPKLQPIEARRIMLQSGMRAPMGVKIRGDDLKTIERVGLQVEKFLKEVDSVNASTVSADRIVGKPYYEIHIDREKLKPYRLTIQDVQDNIVMALQGKTSTTVYQGLERYSVLVRYQRGRRDTKEDIERIEIDAPGKRRPQLKELANIVYKKGPQVLKSEDTRLVGYVTFDMKEGRAEVNVVESCQRYLEEKRLSGDLDLSEVTIEFAGRYKAKLRSDARMRIVLPVVLFLIFLILYLLFRTVSTTLLVFSGIGVAWAGGFVMLWLYGQPWFLNFTIFETPMRELFQVHSINMSTAVWVGFLALFGIASDNGVILGTYLNQTFDRKKPRTVKEIREATVEAGNRRIRPCLMTSATTILALIPILTSTGRGSDIMVPMAIPSFGGMLVVLISVFVVPVLYSFVKEFGAARDSVD